MSTYYNWIDLAMSMGVNINTNAALEHYADYDFAIDAACIRKYGLNFYFKNADAFYMGCDSRFGDFFTDVLEFPVTDEQLTKAVEDLDMEYMIALDVEEEERQLLEDEALMVQQWEEADRLAEIYGMYEDDEDEY